MFPETILQMKIGAAVMELSNALKQAVGEAGKTATGMLAGVPQ